MFRVIFLGFLVFTTFCVVTPTSVYAISLDDEEEDAEDVADILAQAKKAGKSEEFGKADALLKEAKMYGVKTDETKETEKLIANKKAVKAERERKERERLARIKREKEERARQARLAAQKRNTNSSSHSYSSGTSSTLKTFECSYQCRTSGFVFYDHVEFSMTVQAYKYYQAASKVESYADKRCDSMIGAETGLRMWDNNIMCNQRY